MLRVGFSSERIWLMWIALVSIQACRWGYESVEGTESSASSGAGAGAGGYVPAGGTRSRPVTDLHGGGATTAVAGSTNGGATVAAGSTTSGGTTNSGATAAAGSTANGGITNGGAATATGGMTNGGATTAVASTTNSGATTAAGGATNGGITNGGAITGGATAATGGGSNSAETTSMASTLVLSGMNQTAVHGGTTTTPYLDVCPGDAVLVGVQGTVSKVGVILVSSIQGLCANLVLSADGATITTGTTTETPLRGGTGNAWTQSCPSNQVVIGFEGRAGACLDRLAIRCGSLVRQGNAVTVSPGSTLPAVGGTGGEPFTDGCAGGQIARALNLVVLDGNWVDGMGLVCGTSTVVN